VARRAFLGATTTDGVVNSERDTKQLVEKLRAAGVPVTLKIYARANHYRLIDAFVAQLGSGARERRAFRPR
jgi:acetyl esterase/lipase